jgi:glucuronoarabinoxylan endo-1,4-beta-xylanase
MIKQLVFTALLLAPGIAFAADPSASFSDQVVPAGSDPIACNGQTNQPPSADFVVNVATCYQTIDGFGAGEAFSGQWVSQIFDMAFCVNATDPGCANPGIGLTFMREEIEDQYGNDLGDGQKATARGGKIIGTSWQTPYNSGTITTSAQSWVNWATTQQANGVSMYGLTTVNEPDDNSWSASDVTQLIDVLGPLAHAVSPPLKLISPEVATPTTSYGSYTSTIESDSTANAQTDIFSFHSYNDLLPSTSNDNSRHVWMTEGGNSNSSYDPSIADAVNSTAKALHDGLVTFNLSNWMMLYVATGASSGTTDDRMLIWGDYLGVYGVPKRYFAMGNWSRYVRPGWRRASVTGSLSGIYGVSAFVNPVTGAFAIIAVNNSGADIPNVTFGLAGINASGTVIPYVTSGTTVGSLGSDGNLSTGSTSSNVPTSLSVSNGVFTSIVPYGITTFVGSGTSSGPVTAGIGLH